MKSTIKFIYDFFLMILWLVKSLPAYGVNVIKQFPLIPINIFYKKWQTFEQVIGLRVGNSLTSMPKIFWDNHYKLILKILYLSILSLLLLSIARCSYQPKFEGIGINVDKDTVEFTGVSKPLNGIRSVSISVGPKPTLTLPGRLVWDEEKTAKVFSPFAGRVQKVAVQLGQNVSKGQTLAVIQSPEFGMIQTDAKKADSTAQLARLSLQRAQELFSQGIIAKKEFDQVSADASQAFAENDRARTRLRSLGGLQTSIDQSFQLVSTVQGTVIERNIYPGREIAIDLSAPPAIVVSDPSSLWAILELAETDIGRFDLGTQVTIFNNTIPDEKLQGTVSRIADYIDPLSRTVKVRVAVRNNSLKLKAEMFIQAEIPLSHVDGLIVPAKAIILGGESYYVFVETAPYQYVRKKIALGTRFLENTEVLEGLNSSDKIVTEGGLYLNEVLLSQVRVNNHPADNFVSQFVTKLRDYLALILK